MKSSQHVNVINIIPVYFDTVGIPSLWTAPRSWPWSGVPASAGSVASLSAPTHAGVLPLRLSESCPLLRDDLQHELKWFLKPHLWHFLPKAGQSLNWCVVLHLLHILLSQVLWPLILYEPLVLVPFLPFCLKVLMALTVVGCATPPFDLWRLKSLTVISCSLAYWSNAWYVTSSHRFLDCTHFLTSKCLVAWNKSSVLCTSFSSVEYWHLLMRFLILWSSWSVDSLSPCLMSLVDLVDMVPIWRRDFKGVRDSLENLVQIFLSLFIGGYWQCVPPLETFLTEIADDRCKPDVSIDAGCT